MHNHATASQLHRIPRQLTNVWPTKPRTDKRHFCCPRTWARTRSVTSNALLPLPPPPNKAASSANAPSPTMCRLSGLLLFLVLASASPQPQPPREGHSAPLPTPSSPADGESCATKPALEQAAGRQFDQMLDALSHSVQKATGQSIQQGASLVDINFAILCTLCA
jgi:hypothetical protein